MKRTFGIFGGLILAVMVGMSAQAACGGGGYSQSSHSSSSTTTYSSQGGQREVVPASGQIMIRRMDTTQFDQQIRPRLNLSIEQSNSVDKLEMDVKQKTEDSIAKSRSFDARQDFDKRLTEILTPDQNQRYRGMR